MLGKIVGVRVEFGVVKFCYIWGGNYLSVHKSNARLFYILPKLNALFKKHVGFNILTEADSNKIQNVNRLYFCCVKFTLSLQSVKKWSDNNMPNRTLIDCQKKTPFYPYGGIARLFNTRVLYCTLLLYQYCT